MCFKRSFLLIAVGLWLALPAFAEDADTVWTKRTYPNEVRCVKFSPDDQFIAYAIYHMDVYNLDPVVLYAETGEVFKVLKGHKDGWILDLDFHPNGQWLATANNKSEIIIWDYKTGAIVKKIDVENGYAIRSLKFSTDGQYLYSLDGGLGDQIKKWSVNNWQLVKSCPAVDDRTADQLEISPDGKTIAIRHYYYNGNENFDIDFYDAKTFAYAFSIKDAHESIINDICFSPDGKYLASASNDGKVKIWDVETKEVSKEFIDLPCVHPVTFSPDSKYIILGSGCARKWHIYIFNCETKQKVSEYYIDYFSKYTSGMSEIKISKEMNYILAGCYHGLFLLNARWYPSNIEDELFKDDTDTYPNPSNSDTLITFSLNNSSGVEITITDINGIVVTNLFHGFLEKGEHEIIWDTSNIPSGTYFCNIQTARDIQTIKIIVNH